MRVTRDPSEYDDLILEQMDFLLSSARRFDDGRVAEAKRLATVLRVLLHHSGRSHALLEQADMLDSMTFLDSAGEINPRNLLTSSNLVSMRLTVGSGDSDGVALYEPLLRVGLPARLPVREQVRRRIAGEHIPRHPGNRLPFADWWNQEVVKDGEGKTFTRADLVKALANQEGGAHVDPRLGEAYHALSRSNSLRWLFRDEHGERPMTSPVPACVRQIAWELIESIRTDAPNFIPGG